MEEASLLSKCEVAVSMSPRAHLKPHHRLELSTKELQSYKSTSFKTLPDHYLVGATTVNSLMALPKTNIDVVV